jgi:hypothetical protein
MIRNAKALKPTENEVLSAVMDYLAIRGFKVYKQRAGKVKSERGGWMQLAPRGASDLTGWHKATGRALQVEVKRPGEKPTPEQYQWLEEACEARVIAFWCDSVDMAEELLERFGI